MSKLKVVADNQIRIEKGVPLRVGVGGKNGGRPAKYPWAEMEVGDSILVPKTEKNISSTAKNWGQRNGGRMFLTRTVEDGIRVWRVQ